METKVSYEISCAPEFSAIQLANGTIYHQRGEYSIGGSVCYLPVNRSYRPRIPSVYTPLDTGWFTYDKLINDTVPDEATLRLEEDRLQIFGKKLLVLELCDQVSMPKIYSSRYLENPYISSSSDEVLRQLTDSIGSKGRDIALGLHGSHAVGLNGIDSDMDLVAWSSRENREETLAIIGEALISLGFLHANNTNKFAEYSVRIANLTGLGNKIGAFLASQRNRWISPNGTETSLQLIHSNYDHSRVKSIIESALNNGTDLIEDVHDLEVTMLPGSEPFNYPRFWKIECQGVEAEVLSFNMVHQGMGTNGLSANSDGGRFVLKGVKYELLDSRPVYCLESDSDYILPSELIV